MSNENKAQKKKTAVKAEIRTPHPITMFSLPTHILSLIYPYDGTYRALMQQEVLPHLLQYKRKQAVTKVLQGKPWRMRLNTHDNSVWDAVKWFYTSRKIGNDFSSRIERRESLNRFYGVYVWERSKLQKLLWWKKQHVWERSIE